MCSLMAPKSYFVIKFWFDFYIAQKSVFRFMLLSNNTYLTADSNTTDI